MKEQTENKLVRENFELIKDLVLNGVALNGSPKVLLEQISKIHQSINFIEKQLGLKSGE